MIGTIQLLMKKKMKSKKNKFFLVFLICTVSISNAKSPFEKFYLNNFEKGKVTTNTRELIGEVVNTGEFRLDYENFLELNTTNEQLIWERSHTNQQYKNISPLVYYKEGQYVYLLYLGIKKFENDSYGHDIWCDAYDAEGGRLIDSLIIDKFHPSEGFISCSSQISTNETFEINMVQNLIIVDEFKGEMERTDTLRFSFVNNHFQLVEKEIWFSQPPFYTKMDYVLQDFKNNCQKVHELLSKDLNHDNNLDVVVILKTENSCEFPYGFDILLGYGDLHGVKELESTQGGIKLDTYQFSIDNLSYSGGFLSFDISKNGEKLSLRFLFIYSDMLKKWRVHSVHKQNNIKDEDLGQRVELPTNRTQYIQHCAHIVKEFYK